MNASAQAWSPQAQAGEEFVPATSLWTRAVFIFTVRLLTGLGLLLLASAEMLANQMQRPAAGFYIAGGGMLVLFGGLWFLSLWHHPPLIRIVLAPDRMQVQQGLAEVIDEVPYRQIAEVAVLRYSRVAGGGERGLALRIARMEEYLAAWPQLTARRSRDRADTGYDWWMCEPRMRWSELAEALVSRIPRRSAQQGDGDGRSGDTPITSAP